MKIAELEQKMYYSLDLRDGSISIRKLKNNKLCITIRQMYSYVDIDFDFLEFLSKELETKKINFEHGDHISGCESCDYGSSYEINLYVSDFKNLEIL